MSMGQRKADKNGLSVTVLRRKLQAIKGVAFDFDGVFTDNRVWISDDGHESVACCRSDGFGLARLRMLGLPHAILSTEPNRVVRLRARKLKTPCIQGIADKAKAFRNLAASYGLKTTDFVFVGNDTNDSDCLRLAGLAVVPADAFPGVLPLADLILKANGGRGAVREICDLIGDARC